MFGNVTALDGLHVTGKCRDISMTHTCSSHAAWDSYKVPIPLGPLGSSSSQHRRTPELVLQKSHASFRITYLPPGIP